MKTRSTIVSYLPLLAVLGLLVIPRTSLAASISCGQTITGATTSDSENDAYTFSGSAGQVMSFAVNSSDNASPKSFVFIQADIYDPNYNIVASITNTANQFSTNLALALTGTYTIILHASTYNDTGHYWLSLQTVTDGGCDSTSIACGQTKANQTGYYTEMDAYGYSGMAGQTASFALYSSSAGNGAPFTKADIYDPNGNPVASINNASSQYATNLPLAVSGTYTILIHASAYNTYGQYWLSSQSPTEGGCNSTSISCGETLTNRTSYYTEMDAYSYSGTAGQIASFALYSSNAGNGAPFTEADIYDPNGNAVASVNNASSQYATNLPLAISGTYTILIHASAYNTYGLYWLSSQSLTGGGCGGTTLDCGQTVNGQISEASQINAYELVAGASEHVLLSDSGFSGMVVDIYDFSGSNIVKMASSTSTNYIFANAGVYTLLVHAGNYISSGSYSISLTVFGGCDDLPTVSVAPTNLVLYPGSSATFTATAGGPTPFYYQWRFNDSQILGATNAIYSITSVGTNSMGDYAVVVSNPGGSVTSAPPAIISLGALQLGLKFSGTGLMLTWPTNFTGFTLQAATNLTPPTVWSNVVVTPSTANGQNVVSNSISGPQRFYRLTQ